MRFSVLSSGSRANCTYLEAGGARLLIDCGLSATAAERRLLSLGIDPDSIDAILVTHEHRDHIYGIPTFSRRHRVPIYANRPTARHLPKVFGVERFISTETFSLAGIQITPCQIEHDADEPVAFLFEVEGLRLAQVTDLGVVTPQVENLVRNCHSLIIESNHDEDLLNACGYPWVLKQRILSEQGHLSNRAAAALIKASMHSDLRHVVLAHISENSNRPEVAHQTVSEFLGEKAPRSLICSSVRHTTPLIEVGSDQHHLILQSA